MINHFFFAYSGNKRNECELLVDNYISNKETCMIWWNISLGEFIGINLLVS